MGGNWRSLDISMKLEKAIEESNQKIRKTLRKHKFTCNTIFADIQKELWYGKIDGRMVVVHVMGGAVDYFTEHHGILGSGRLQDKLAEVEL